jgi:hypothetical protein
MKITKLGKTLLAFALGLMLISCKVDEKEYDPLGCFIVRTTCGTGVNSAVGEKEYCGINEADIKKTIHNTGICTVTYRRK